MDIDQYYEKKENREKLKKINESKFPDMVEEEKEGDGEQELQTE